jgi:Flp pilus assembly protein TadD
LVLPITMADARLRQARDAQLQERDPVAALQSSLDAQAFDPTWAEPVITEGALHAQADRPVRAANAGRRAVQLEPRNWSVQLRASGLIGLVDRQAGLDAFRAARELNPQLPARLDAGETERPDVSPDALQNPDS